MLGLTIRAPRHVIERFKRDARLAFPHEAYAVLIGHEEADVVEITELWTPDHVGKCFSGRVDIHPLWFVEAEEFARDIGAVVVGDIHSHPYQHGVQGCGHEQSECDLDYAPHWQKIAGICRVTQSRAGRLRASVRFWGPLIPVKTELTRAGDSSQRRRGARTSRRGLC
jgi:proteasome lid subunit RPN8/RPN11